MQLEVKECFALNCTVVWLGTPKVNKICVTLSKRLQPRYFFTQVEAKSKAIHYIN